MDRIHKSWYRCPYLVIAFLLNTLATAMAAPPATSMSSPRTSIVVNTAVTTLWALAVEGARHMTTHTYNYKKSEGIANVMPGRDYPS